MTEFSIRRATAADAPVITGHRRAMFAEMAHAGAARLDAVDAVDAAFLPWVFRTGGPA